MDKLVDGEQSLALVPHGTDLGGTVLASHAPPGPAKVVQKYTCQRPIYPVHGHGTTGRGRDQHVKLDTHGKRNVGRSGTLGRHRQGTGGRHGRGALAYFLPTQSLHGLKNKASGDTRSGLVLGVPQPVGVQQKIVAGSVAERARLRQFLLAHYATVLGQTLHYRTLSDGTLVALPLVVHGHVKHPRGTAALQHPLVAGHPQVGARIVAARQRARRRALFLQNRLAHLAGVGEGHSNALRVERRLRLQRTLILVHRAERLLHGLKQREVDQVHHNARAVAAAQREGIEVQHGTQFRAVHARPGKIRARHHVFAVHPALVQGGRQVRGRAAQTGARRNQVELRRRQTSLLFTQTQKRRVETCLQTPRRPLLQKRRERKRVRYPRQLPAVRRGVGRAQRDPAGPTLRWQRRQAGAEHTPHPIDTTQTIQLPNRRTIRKLCWHPRPKVLAVRGPGYGTRHHGVATVRAHLRRQRRRLAGRH